MKKTLLTLLAAALMLPAAAQYQIPNSDFETWGNSSGEPRYWHGFKSAKGTWAGMAKGTLASSTDKHGGNYSAVVTSGKVLTVINNGTMTNGQLQAASTTASNTGNHSEMDKSSDATDNYGDKYYTPISGKPDALKLWLKFTQGTAQTTYKYSTVSAILFDGSYYQDPEDKTYTNVAAKAQNKQITTGGWRELTIPFDYASYASNNASIAAILMTVSTNATPGKGSSGDKVWIDDVELVYNSELASVTYNGSAVSVASAMDLSSEDYDETKLALTHNAKGNATISKSYDAANALLTITVYGENYGETTDADYATMFKSSTNFHTYTIQFKKASAPAATLSALSVGGFDVALQDGVYEYTMPFAYNAGIAVEATAGENCTLVADPTCAAFDEPVTENGFYDEKTKTITVKVLNAVNDETDYVVHFTDEKATPSVGTTYPGALLVTLSFGDQDMKAPLENTNISFSENQDGTLNVILKNFQFALAGMNVGDIYVPALSYDPATGKVTGIRNVRIVSDDPEAVALQLGHLPVAVDMTILDVNKAAAEGLINIITTESTISAVSMFSAITVDFMPFQIDESAPAEYSEEGNMSYTEQTITGYVSKASVEFLEINNAPDNVPMSYIDMTGAEFANDVTAEDLKTGAPADNNTIYYVPASANFLAGTNVVVGNSTTEFALNDKVSVNIPTAFNALKVSYNRGFTAGNWSTFVTPVGVSTSDIDGTVYELTGCSADAFEFTEVTGNVVANKPYLVKLNGASLFTGTTAATVAAASQTEENMTVTAGRVTQVGSYQRQETTSDASKTWYGYTGGRFVKSNNGVINPFRTAFYVTGGSDARSFGLNIGDATGINQTVMNIEDAPAYDLQGRRVKNAQKGTFIIGGNKVILK